MLYQLLKNINKFKYMLQNADEVASQMLTSAANKVSAMAQQGIGNVLSIGGINVQQLFAMVDKDGNGRITLSEFMEICKLMSINISNENLMRIFSMADKKGQGFLDMEQFMYAFFRLRLLVAFESLNKIGLTKSELLIAFVISITFLLVLFAFIFVGIQAFSYANSFGSVVNSIMPAGAGVSVSGKKEDGKMESIMSKLKSSVEDALDDLKL